jgi:hypothetical protein
MCWDMLFLLALCFSFFVEKTFVHKTNVKVDTSIYHIGGEPRGLLKGFMKFKIKLNSLAVPN